MVTQKYKIIRYTDSHKNALNEMIFGLYAEDPEGEPMTPEKIEATIEQATKYPDSLQIFIMEVDGAAAGYAIIQLIWSNEWGGLTANIDEMYVAEHFRGQGLATDFIRNVTVLIPDITRITLEVTPSNDKGMKFYEALGFRQAENRFMELPLGL